MADPAQPQPSSEQNQPSFQIEKVYVKDLSLEIPHAPQVFVQQVQPQLEIQIHTNAAQFSEGYYECSVTATVTAKAGERGLILAGGVLAGVTSTLVPRGAFPPWFLIASRSEPPSVRRRNRGGARPPAESKIELARWP